MVKEIMQRQERARKIISNEGLGALVLAATENVQYLGGVAEPSVNACGVIIVPLEAEPVLAVMWLDKKAAEEQAEEVSIQVYTPESQGGVITEALEQSEIKQGKIGLDDRALKVLGNSLRRTLPRVDLLDASALVEELRWVKSAEEIRLIEKACEISKHGMDAAIESLEPGSTELQIASEAEHCMMEFESDRPKHVPIVASGWRASLVHPFASSKKIERGDLVAIDIGATYHGYCSDIARTAAVGRPSEDLRNDFDVLHNAQEAVIQKLRPGVSRTEIEATVRSVLEPAGCQLIGYVGHGIGLQVQEGPSLSHRASDVKMEGNMVLAFFQSMIQSKRSLGIRLEDTVVVTESGAERLTDYPRELLSV